MIRTIFEGFAILAGLFFLGWALWLLFMALFIVVVRPILLLLDWLHRP